MKKIKRKIEKKLTFSQEKFELRTLFYQKQEIITQS